LNIWQKLYKAK